jgi:hypothetical protein
VENDTEPSDTKTRSITRLKAIILFLYLNIKNRLSNRD